VACGRIGFRDVRVDRDGGRIRFVVNGVPVFCRGSCWTTADVVSLVGSPEDVRATLELAAEGNANMIRVGGTMVYESDAFYDACDELGLMVWQDFMFANMDYPADDDDFVSGVEDEARYQVGRLARHPSLVAFCGGSEVEQQAAMFGADRSLWSNRVFSETLPAVVEELSPGTPYWPSTPTGGALPFQTGEGLTHYYGVGAYKRPLTDVRLAGVRFTPECLGFSNVPEPSNLRGLTPTGAVPPHHPAWKAGVPRDTGPGWDFEDVRDHYLGTRYGVRPGVLRGEDLERYLGLSRIVTGEVMERVFDEWRSENDGCGGALTWFLNDLRPGAGWGIIDSDREPKAVYHYLRRAWAPVACRILDRGLDGLVVSVLNERSSDLEAVLEVAVVARGATVVAEARESIRVAGRARLGVGVESLLGHFVDSTYAYRFGPPRHEAVVATLVDEDGAVVSQDVYRPLPALMNDRGSLALEAEAAESGHVRLTLRADALLYGVRIEARDHRPEDNYFDLIPGRARTVLLRPISDGGASLRGSVEAVNLADAIRLPRV
jgi:beta-mannosidase